MKKNQKGFGVIEILVVVLVLALMATIGWLVYDRQSNKQATTNDSKQTTSQKQSTDTDQTPELETITLKTFALSYDDTWKVVQQKSETGPCGDGLPYEKIELAKDQKTISVTVNECGKDAVSDVVVDYAVSNNMVTIPNKNLSVCKPDPAYEMDFCSSGDGSLIAIGSVGTADGLKSHYYIQFTNKASEDVTVATLSDIYAVLETIKLSE